MSIPITLDRSSPVPLHRQLYRALRAAIQDGRLGPGSRLASSRQLAAELGLARTTVLAAYDQLTADGLLEAREGAWTSVARVLPDGAGRPFAGPRVYAGRATPAATDDMVALAQQSATYSDPFQAPLPFDFRRVNAPALDAFPFDEWRRLIAEQWRAITPATLVNYDSAGLRELRTEIVRFVRTTRGIECHPDQAIITTGSEHSIGLLCRILLPNGSVVALEDPSHLGAQNVFRAHGASIEPMSVDPDGIVVAELARCPTPPKLVYVTPTRQFPTGVVLSHQRRRDLLQWAAAHRAMIIEDDHDSELSYAGGTLEALQALDGNGVVAYVGSFAKVLIPWIQIGYLILPPQLVKPAVFADRIFTRQTDLVHQAVLARFMNTGGLARHLYRLRRVHLARRNALVDALRTAFQDDVAIGPANSGLQVHVRWRDQPITAAVLRQVMAEGVGLLPVRPMCIREPTRDPGVVMAYASLTEAEIRDGVAILADVLGGEG